MDTFVAHGLSEHTLRPVQANGPLVGHSSWLQSCQHAFTTPPSPHAARGGSLGPTFVKRRSMSPQTSSQSAMVMP